MKKLTIIALLLISVLSFAQSRINRTTINPGQKIEFKNKKYYINNNQIPSYEIKQYLKESNYKAFSMFEKAKEKATFGGLFIGLGSALIAGDLVKGLVSDVKYPSAMTYIGGTFLAVSIPILAGKNKKMVEAIDTYNNSLSTENELNKNTKTAYNIISNKNGIGLQITF